MAEKLIYGLDKVHFAPITVEADGSITFGTPMRLYGATEFKASPAGESVKIYADNGVYYEVSANQGYEVELSIHNVPREFETHALGVVYDEENGTMTEVANAKGGAFALLWEFETDQSPTRHLFYNCTATRGDIESKSLEDKIDASPTTLKITASPIELDGEKIVKVRTVASESPSAKAIYDNWYKTVFRKGEISNSEELTQPKTADVTFDLTTPTKGAGNTISGGGATKTVTVNVANQTQSVATVYKGNIIKINNGLPILRKDTPQTRRRALFLQLGKKGGTTPPGSDEKSGPFFHAQNQEVNVYAR